MLRFLTSFVTLLLFTDQVFEGVIVEMKGGVSGFHTVKVSDTTNPAGPADSLASCKCQLPGHLGKGNYTQHVKAGVALQ